MRLEDEGERRNRRRQLVVEDCGSEGEGVLVHLHALR